MEFGVSRQPVEGDLVASMNGSFCEKVGWVALCHLSFSGRRGLLDGS